VSSVGHVTGLMGPSSRTDIAVILVGINSRAYLQECLASLDRVEWGGYSHRVVYVDNASSDGSVAMVRDDFPGVKILANERNAGFCAACNQGAALVESRYIYLLNNDTILFPNSIRLLAEFLERRPDAAAAGNRLLNPDLTDQWSARRFPTWLNAIFGRRSALSRWLPGAPAVRDYLYKDEFGGDTPFAVDWVPGSCTLVRREAYEQAGGLPENMHYWSDAVFCDRMRRNGWKSYVVPAARLIHHEGKGSGEKSPQTRRWLISDFHQGAYRFYCEHYGLARWSPARWIARAGLGARALLLTAADSVRDLAKPKESRD